MGEVGKGDWGPGPKKHKTSPSQCDGRAVTFNGRESEKRRN